MTEFINFLHGTSSVNLSEVLINVVLSMVLSQMVYTVFVRFGNTFSNRKQFGQIFFLVTVSTTLIISIIQASLALSLGLVGALSIVRFRTAIKEPEELAYTFFAITIGIGCGANARGLTIATAMLVLICLIIRGMSTKKDGTSDTYNFNVVSKTLSLNELNELVSKYTHSHTLRRTDKNQTMMNTQYILEFSDVAQLEQLNKVLAEKDSEVTTSFMSNSTFL